MSHRTDQNHRSNLQDDKPPREIHIQTQKRNKINHMKRHVSCHELNIYNRGKYFHSYSCRSQNTSLLAIFYVFLHEFARVSG